MSTRNIVNMRPQGDPNAMVYSPHRDLANIFIPMMKEVLGGLKTDNWPDYFAEWAKSQGITDQSFGDGLNRLVAAIQMFTGDASIREPADALWRVNFQGVPGMVRTLIFARMGEVLLGGFFVAVRDVTYAGQEPPMAKDIAEMVAIARVLAERLGGRQSWDIPEEVRVARETEALLDGARRALQRQTNLTTIAEGQLAVVQQSLDHLKARHAELRDTHARWQNVIRKSWWRRLGTVIRWWWNKELS